MVEAYIDPGSGSLLIQVIIATILAVPFFLKNQVSRVIGLVRRRDRTDAPVSRESPQETSD